MKPASPELGEVLRRWLDAEREDIHTALPARVESYNASTQRCTAQPLIKRRYVDGAGVTQVERRPVVVEVPVVWPGGGGAAITCPLAVGDTVLLIFGEASMDAWLAGNGAEVDPQDDRRHAFSDGIAIPDCDRRRCRPGRLRRTRSRSMAAARASRLTAAWRRSAGALARTAPSWRRPL